jgi:putative Mg2+ transporter-C (MgtC) family protein
MQDIPFDLYSGMIAMRLTVTVVLTGFIGWDRERLRKPAGLRTHILVGLGSALAMLISILTGPVVNGQYQMDPRIAQNVLTGIGFLGAGTILHLREGVVSGLTTAATLWASAVIGLAVGCGFYSGALLTTVLVLLTLYFLNLLDDYIVSRVYHNLTLRARVSSTLTETVREVLRDHNVKIIRTEVQTGREGERFVVIHFKPIPVAAAKVLSRRIDRLPGIQEAIFN